MSRLLTLGLVQHACGEDPSVNLARCVEGIREASRRGARLVVTQELFRTRYFCQREDASAFDLAEPVPGPTTERLAVLAAELGVVVVASLFERRAAGLYHNTAVVLDHDRGLVGRYRKMHIPDDPGYYEKYYFTPGDLGLTPVETSIGRLGILVCWDQWFPEAARLMTLAGAELLVYPTAIGWDPRDPADEQARQMDAWRTIQRAHAIANGLPVAACNRIGFEPEPGSADGGIQFWGGSFLCGAQGELLAEAPADRATVLVASLDLNRTEQVRRAWPYLRDRRIDAYEGLSRRYLD